MTILTWYNESEDSLRVALPTDDAAGNREEKYLGILFCFSRYTTLPYCADALNFRSVWKNRLPELAARIAEHLSLPESDILYAIEQHK